MYQKGNQEIWKGRTDPQYGSEGKLWHQAIMAINLPDRVPEKTPVLLGFCTDEGVRRNLGRSGAVAGPDALRKALCNLAFHFSIPSVNDGGNCLVSGRNLEGAHTQLSGLVKAILDQASFPIVLGGGHEISYAHFRGLAQAFLGKRVGIINFDPHLDVRTYENGGHSGSWARQLLDEFPSLSYLPIGINPQVNVKALFSYMEAKGQSFLTMDELINDTPRCKDAIQTFASTVDVLGVTLDLDVFSGALAPGVSAPAAYGAFPQHIFPLLEAIAQTKKWRSFDIAELNPAFDDGRTAKLAAQMVDKAIGLIAPQLVCV